MRVLAGLQGNLDRLGRTQQQLSSGKQLSRPADSPTGTVAAMQLRSAARAQDQYARNAGDGLGWLDTIDGALTSTVQVLHRVRDLTVAGLSTGTAGPSARQALATEVAGLRETVIGLANTRYLDRPVFGGTTSGAVAYDPSGAYVGDSGSVSRTVAAGDPMRVDVAGPGVFGSADTGLLGVLSDIATHLTGDPAALATDLDALDDALAQVSTALADVGARAARIEQAAQAAQRTGDTLRAQLSDVEDIDLPKTLIDLSLQQTAYQAALGAAGRVVQTSLLDFLR
jgi:flagellar hook-associated protein 3 FlgL